MLLLTLLGCVSVDCGHFPHLDRVSFSTEEASVWLTGVEGGFGEAMCSRFIERTEFILSADEEPQIMTYEWNKREEAPFNPPSFSPMFNGGPLDCDGCLLEMPTPEYAPEVLAGHVLRVHTDYAAEQYFDLALLDADGEVVAEGGF